MKQSPAMPPEPSDAERATWPSCTVDYVSALEATAARVWDFESDWKHQHEKRLAAEARVAQEMEYANASRNIAASLHGALVVARSILNPDVSPSACELIDAALAGRAALEQGGQS